MNEGLASTASAFKLAISAQFSTCVWFREAKSDSGIPSGPKGQGAVKSTTTPGGTKAALPLRAGYSPGHQGQLDDEEIVVPSQTQEGYEFESN
jgi:hypothetical protein